MKNKAILVSIIALFAIVFTLNAVIASTVDISSVEVNGVEVVGLNALAGEVSETVPVDVRFTANGDYSDVRVKVYIEGYRDEISAETSRFHVVDGSTYVKRFTLKLPSSMDLDDLTEDLKLYVRVSAKGEEIVEESYNLNMQKQGYSLNILSIEAPETVVAGSVVAVDVVLQNNGNDRLDNNYVKVSIAELGVVKKVYFGDLSPVVEEDYDDIRDTTEKRIYLTIPRNSVPGVYNMEVEAYNYDASVSAKQKIAISGAETGILPSITAKTIAMGEETTFSVVLVNPNDRMVVYSVTPTESEGLIVTVDEPIVTIPADSSKTVMVKVKATSSAEEGTHLVTVNVNSESGLVRQVNFTVNVEEETATSNTVLVLTVVLAIIFVVLLIVLIVLLTKKPAESEEFGETSYY